MGIIIGIVVLALAGVVYASVSNTDTMAKKDMMAEDKAMMDKKAMEEKEAMMDAEKMGDESMMKKEGETDMNKDMMKGSYEEYSADKIARAETGDVVLFFHASWCPSCRALNSDIEANMGAIPEGVSILKVNYDAETELKKKYGVTNQHTLVQVDKDGILIKKWSGGSKLSDVLSQIQ